MGLFDRIFPPKVDPVERKLDLLLARTSQFRFAVEQAMSALSDKIDAAFAAVEAEHAQVTAAVGALKAEIAALKDQIATGGVTEGDLTRLDELASAITGVFTPDA